jgi:prepilin-type N-terminal cleavage/methylation domain-containing protein
VAGVWTVPSLSKFIRQQGFTLIELLIVIAIILILISIALPNFLEAQIRAKVARVQGDVRSISQGQIAYFLDRKVYTNDCGGGNPGCLQLTTPIKYMASIPFDPFGVHRFGSGENYLMGEVRAFYPMGTGTWGSVAYLKANKIYPNTQEPIIRDAFIIYSAGPTWNQLEPGGPTGTFPQPQDECNWTKYSPTNGTRSYGGIIRVGGSLPPAYKRLTIGQ